ncbi:MAG: hypothetical protein CMQ26_04615 [Gammaproteobacteria bacterium]|nr:hypothetical protein [Gammaproteobacteria bacterium]
MSVTDLIGLKSEKLSFEGKLTSVILTDTGGTITGKGDASKYGTAFLTYDLTVNPSVAGQGVMTGTASAIDDDGNLVTAALNGVFDRNGHEIKIYCVDDLADGAINLAVVSMNLKTDDFQVHWSEIDR